MTTKGGKSLGEVGCVRTVCVSMAQGRGRRRAEGGPEAEESMGSQAQFRGLEALGNWRDGRGGHPIRANGRLSLNI
jgi:hypothetical protein